MEREKQKLKGRKDKMVLTKKQELEKRKKQNEKLLKMLGEERERVEGYKQIIKLYGAYIAILLEKMGTTIDNTVLIEKAEVTGAMSRIEARAKPTDNGWGFYCEVINEGGICEYGVQEEVATVEGKEENQPEGVV